MNSLTCRRVNPISCVAYTTTMSGSTGPQHNCLAEFGNVYYRIWKVEIDNSDYLGAENMSK